jgi:phosphate starvation-inducible protein PhoH and related proteins
VEATIQLDSAHSHLELFGTADNYLRLLRQRLEVKIVARADSLLFSGEDRAVRKAVSVIDAMQKTLLAQGSLSREDVEGFIEQKERVQGSQAIEVYAHKKFIEPSTAGQLKYIKTMMKNDLTFCIGPAGTGKTYLAVAVAVSMLKKKQIKKIILARPAVEAGEKLGFLPGDLKAKVNPYLRPLFDAIGDMMSYQQMKSFIELDIIELIPLAFMRGRTFNQAAIICDEAQNTSPSQMLMILTRLGNGSKMIITGDITQVDLPKGQESGMLSAMRILKPIKGIGTVELVQTDIVRHKLVQNIVMAYKKSKAVDE